MSKESFVNGVQNRMKLLIFLVIILAGFVYYDAINDIINGDSGIELTNSWLAIGVMTLVFVLNILISLNLKKWADFYTKK